MTRVIGPADLTRHASRYVDAADHGETIEVTRHGRPVARLSSALVKLAIEEAETPALRG